ncbi:MAG: hypothetical protein KC609_09095 [Myxococcales bacterium]|nr:hypothetical protein [Myxococcales bacterium]
MNRRSVASITICLTLALSALSGSASALTCAQSSLSEKIKHSNVVLVGELVRVERYSASIKVLKVLKPGSALRPGTTQLSLRLSRYTSLGWAGKPGQIVLFFLDARGTWNCHEPIRLM